MTLHGLSMVCMHEAVYMYVYGVGGECDCMMSMGCTWGVGTYVHVGVV